MKILKITFILFAFLCVSNINNEAYTQESDITLTGLRKLNLQITQNLRTKTLEIIKIHWTM